MAENMEDPTTTTTPAPGATLSDDDSPRYGMMGYETSASMVMFVICLIIPGCVIAFFAYKLVASLREKERLKEEKKKLKQQRKEKELKVKQKKK